MLIIPKPVRARQVRFKAQKQPILMSAVYQDSPTQWITLKFDRPIDVSHIAGTQILVNDAYINEVLMEANGSATLLDPMTVRIRLNILGDSTGTGVQLNANATNGILSADGSPWAGVEELALPFGA